MKRIIGYLIPLLIILNFALFMNSGKYLKQSVTQPQPIQQSINKIETNILNSNWHQANINLKKLITAWHKCITRIQFIVDREEIKQLSTNLSRLKGTIKTKDKAKAIVELKEANLHWENLGE